MVKAMADDWTAVEYVIEVLDDIRRRLKAGAQGPGVTLDADECTKVLGALVDPPWPKGRPPESGTEQATIAIYCFKLEREGYSVEAAVKATANALGCSVSTVYAARATVSSN
jgi:hypothetical protein